MSLRVIFFNSITFNVITQDGKGGTMWPVELASQTGPFRHLSKHVFQCREYQKFRSYEGDLSSKIFEI